MTNKLNLYCQTLEEVNQNFKLLQQERALQDK